MITFSEMKVQGIVNDLTLSIDDKIRKLRGYEAEARGLQRRFGKLDECR